MKIFDYKGYLKEWVISFEGYFKVEVLNFLYIFGKMFI